MRVLVLAALQEEADAFLRDQGVALPGGWFPARRITALGHDFVIATTGVGKVNMASVAANLHARETPDLLAVIGTAGKLSAKEGDCFYLARSVQHDYGARRGEAFVHYNPGAWPLGPAVMTPYEAMTDPGLGLPHATIVGGDAFIEDAEFARHLVGALDGDLVDMETAALSQFATLVDLPWVAIKAVTDDANHDSAGDFYSNLLDASKRAAQALERLVGLLQP